MTALNASQLDQLVNKLKTDYQALLHEVREELENSGNQHRIDLLNSEPGDSGDESMANALSDFNLTILDRHVDAIRDIEAAFRRVKNGEYGVCTDCGVEIAHARLQAYPTAKRCLACQEKHEREHVHESHPKM